MASLYMAYGVPPVSKISVNIRLDDAIKDRWDKLAQEHGLDRDKLMQEALIERLEELEDFYIVGERLRTEFTPVSSDEVWKRLGLED
jgi:predicted DNA-binding protein